MHILVQPSKSSCFPNSSLPLNNFDIVYSTLQNLAFPTIPRCPIPKNSYLNKFSSFGSLRSLVFSKNLPILRGNHFTFCSRNDVLDGFLSTHLSDKSEENISEDNEEIELLDKPFPIPRSNESVSEVDDGKPDKDEVLAPFLKFFNQTDGLGEGQSELRFAEDKGELDYKGEEEKKVNVEYYEPKPGDFVVGVVVSGNENKLDVNVGANLLGTMLTKEVLPLYDKELDYLLCDPSVDAEEFLVPGKMGIVKNNEAVNGVPMQGRPVVEPGTVLFAEVLGRTLSGRPLLSTRRLFRRIAWHRVRQIKQLNEPLKVTITEWNTGGLLTRIEGLRGFLPKAELMKRVNNFTELKENVGRGMYVQISRIDEAKNDLILSEKQAWEKLYLSEGALLEGTVRKVFPYGAQIQIGETNRSGLLHVSNITRAQITSVIDLLGVGEKVKVLVVKSLFPDKISLSIADLESEPGLFTTNKEKVFSEAEMMAKKYRQKLPAGLASRRSEPPLDDTLFQDEATMYANWKWFKFERDVKVNQTDP
ncbi:hypothetical protein UlMin_036485 [Ulmus minor]